jgi:hypothetical protein
MPRIRVAMLALGLAAGVAACGGDRAGDGTVARDTTITTVPDTVLIERTTTVDTVRNPDLDRGRDTLQHGDTIRRRNP